MGGAGWGYRNTVPSHFLSLKPKIHVSTGLMGGVHVLCRFYFSLHAMFEIFFLWLHAIQCKLHDLYSHVD